MKDGGVPCGGGVWLCVDFVSVLQGRVDGGEVGFDGLGPWLGVTEVFEGTVETQVRFLTHLYSFFGTWHILKLLIGLEGVSMTPPQGGQCSRLFLPATPFSWSQTLSGLFWSNTAPFKGPRPYPVCCIQNTEIQVCPEFQRVGLSSTQEQPTQTFCVPT